MNNLQIFSGIMTVIQEAGNQSYVGKLGVAYVICNSCEFWKRSLTDEVFKPYRYSCWLPGSPTLANLDKAGEVLVAECTKAMLAAVYRLEPDPTHGAVFYLNPEVVKAATGKLPDWWDVDGDPVSEVTIGDHVFRRHRSQQGPTVKV